MENENRQEKLTRKEFDKITSNLSEDDRRKLWNLLNEVSVSQTNTSLDIVDYSCECSMCGKPMPYRFCGMCPTCEMVWNS